MASRGARLGANEGELVPVERLAREARRARARGRSLPDSERPLVDTRALERELRAHVSGEVRFDAASRALYASDASNYRRIPLGVVIPESKRDVIATVAACRSYGAPIVSRGGGTALAGQTVNEAVVIDFSKRHNRILAIDPIAKRARVELGVVCDDLVQATRPFGITWGPKPATHNRCCFGGMLANNCGGMHAQMNGIAVHNVEALDVLLYDGTRLNAGWMDEESLANAIREGGAAGALFARLRALRDRYAGAIRSGYPKLPRRVSGYNLDELLPREDGRFNLARVLVGSEGTLVTMLEATLQLIDDPPVHAAVVLGYHDVYAAADAVPSFLRFRPLALEGVDDVLYDHIQRKGGEHAEHLALLSGGRGWLCLDIGAASEDEVRRIAGEIVRTAGSALVDSRVYLDAARQKMLWDAREGALGATAFVPDEPDSWPGWEDSAVTPERLGAYLRDLRALYDRYDYHPSLYGHFGMGLIHCRVPFDLYNQHGVTTFRRFMSDAADLVVSYGGSLSGEHGDGQARGELLEKMFGAELMQAMRELKAIFDPYGKMNPGKIVDPYPIVDHLRLWPSYAPALPETRFSYADDGGSFARATLRCVGVGRCRRKDGDGDHDVMCPSYMVTREEKHSTRGRAHLLWEMLEGDGPIKDGWKDEGVKEALDLCLACKGCKGDCPVSVDVATYKAEFLSHYYEGRLRPRHAYAFGYVDKWARLASLAPGVANLVTQLPGTRALAKLAAGVSQDAPIPPFAPATFRKLFAVRGPHVRGDRKVVLWADTFNDNFHHDTLMAAVEVLEAAGYEVIVPRAGACCGRPLYDFGLVDTARAYLENVLSALAPHLAAALPIVVLEPSCASVFRDEAPNLMPARDDVAVLRDRTMLLGELLTKEAQHYTLPKLSRRAIVQGHCHHKSVLDIASEKEALRAMGLDFEVLEAGCCGMAGAFGFVELTREVGRACGERALLPRVRKESDATLVIANGFSCREQIAQHTERRGLHLAEVVKLALDAGPHGPIAGRPEAATIARRAAAVRRSMVRSAVAIGVALAVAGVAALALHAAIRRLGRSR
jgi:FAD/FMN-containing dehydrogenase/Fe-S oxidoreductase